MTSARPSLGCWRASQQGNREQTLLGVTGSGKTFTVANVINELQRPTLVLSPNKTLAAQLWAEFREFFPANAVEFFVSYYDYYQPEAYIPRTDTYIEKDSSRNEEIDRLRNSATRALLTRRDVIVVASVSCIYGIGSPENYLGESISLKVGESWRRDILLRKLSDLQYTRNDTDFGRSRFRVRGDVLDVQPAYEELAVRIELFGDQIESIREFDPLTGEVVAHRESVAIFPASHYVTPAEQMQAALERIEAELKQRVRELEERGRLLEAQRLRQRTGFDMEMMRETGTCAGIENYSRHLTGRAEGQRPYCLLDFLPEGSLIVVDESHVAVPQIDGMAKGDRARKIPLVEYGFRLPSRRSTTARSPSLSGTRWSGRSSTSARPPAPTRRGAPAAPWSRSTVPPDWSTRPSRSSPARDRSTTSSPRSGDGSSAVTVH